MSLDLKAGTIEAERIIVKAPNGNCSIEMVGYEHVAGVWVKDEDEECFASLQMVNGLPQMSIAGPKDEVGHAISFYLNDRHKPVVQFVRGNEVLTMDFDDLTAAAESLDLIPQMKSDLDTLSEAICDEEDTPEVFLTVTGPDGLDEDLDMQLRSHLAEATQDFLAENGVDDVYVHVD